MGHKHGIGPQSLGASGMNPKSTPCGHSRTMGNYGTPLDATAAQNAAFGPGSELAKEDPQRAAKILEGINAEDSGANYMEKKTPLEFNVFENADPRAAANMMSDMAPTGGGNTMVNSQPGQAAFDIHGGRGMTASEIGPGGLGGSGGIFGGILRRKAGRSSMPSKYGDRKGRGTAARAAMANIKQKTGSLPGFGSAGPTVTSPGGGSGGAIAAAEAAQASADAANSQMDALKEKLSGIRSQLDSLSGMI